MTGERQDLVDVIHDICVHAPDAGAADWAPQLWRSLCDAGFTGLGVPEVAAGSGGDLVDVVAALVAIGAAAVPVPLAESSLLGGWLLAEAGLSIPAGPFAVAAPDGLPPVPPAGSSPLLRRLDDGGAAVSGAASGVAWGQVAHHVAVLAPAEAGLCVALVPSAGCGVTPGWNLAGEPRDALDFVEVRVGAESVGAVSEHAADELVLRGALSRAALMVGGIDAVLTATVEYAALRCQFGRPIAAFQAVQQELAVLAGESFAAKAALRAAMAAVGPGPVRAAWRPIASAKIRVGRAAARAASVAHQVHGAIGFTAEHALHRWTTRLWSWRDEYGTEAAWAERLGEDVRALGPAAFELALTLDRPSGDRVTG